MNWIYWLVIFMFPATIEYGNARYISAHFLHSGEFGSPSEVIELAREQCQSLPGCGPVSR